MLKVKHIVKESKRQVFVRYYQIGTFEVQIVENIIARLHGLIKIKGDIHL